MIIFPRKINAVSSSFQRASVSDWRKRWGVNLIVWFVEVNIRVIVLLRNVEIRRYMWSFSVLSKQSTKVSINIYQLITYRLVIARERDEPSDENFTKEIENFTKYFVFHKWLYMLDDLWRINEINLIIWWYSENIHIWTHHT